jgi:hypothetical protein
VPWATPVDSHFPYRGQHRVRRDKTSTSASALTPDHENGSEPFCQAALLLKALDVHVEARHANAVAEVRTNAGVVGKPRG